MALKEAYTSQALAPLLGLTRQGVDAQAKSGGWKSRPRKGRGGGKEWLVSSMPEATQLAIQIAEERRAIEEETTNIAALPAVATSLLPSSARQAILDDKRRYKALAKADLLGLFIWTGRQSTAAPSSRSKPSSLPIRAARGANSLLNSARM